MFSALLRAAISDAANVSSYPRAHWGSGRWGYAPVTYELAGRGTPPDRDAHAPQHGFPQCEYVFVAPRPGRQENAGPVQPQRHVNARLIGAGIEEPQACPKRITTPLTARSAFPVLAKQVVHRLDQHQLSRPPLLDGEDAELLMRLHVDEGGFERASTLTINALAQPLARLETRPVPGRNRHRRPSPGVAGDIRARRNRSEKLPKPRISIRPPLARRAAICSNINRTASVTSRSTSWGSHAGVSSACGPPGALRRAGHRPQPSVSIPRGGRRTGPAAASRQRTTDGHRRH